MVYLRAAKDSGNIWIIHYIIPICSPKQNHPLYTSQVKLRCTSSIITINTFFLAYLKTIKSLFYISF